MCLCEETMCVCVFSDCKYVLALFFWCGGHCGYFNSPWVPINKCLKHTVHNYVHTWASIRVLWHVSSTAQKALWQWANPSRAPEDSAEGVQWHLWFIPWGGIVIWSSAAVKCRRSAGNTVKAFFDVLAFSEKVRLCETKITLNDYVGDGNRAERIVWRRLPRSFGRRAPAVTRIGLVLKMLLLLV